MWVSQCTRFKSYSCFRRRDNTAQELVATSRLANEKLSPVKQNQEVNQGTNVIRAKSIGCAIPGEHEDLFSQVSLFGKKGQFPGGAS